MYVVIDDLPNVERTYKTCWWHKDVVIKDPPNIENREGYIEGREDDEKENEWRSDVKEGYRSQVVYAQNEAHSVFDKNDNGYCYKDMHRGDRNWYLPRKRAEVDLGTEGKTCEFRGTHATVGDPINGNTLLDFTMVNSVRSTDVVVDDEEEAISGFLATAVDDSLKKAPDIDDFVSELPPNRRGRDLPHIGAPSPVMSEDYILQTTDSNTNRLMAEDMVLRGFSEPVDVIAKGTYFNLSRGGTQDSTYFRVLGNKGPPRNKYFPPISGAPIYGPRDILVHKQTDLTSPTKGGQVEQETYFPVRDIGRCTDSGRRQLMEYMVRAPVIDDERIEDTRGADCGSADVDDIAYTSKPSNSHSPLRIDELREKRKSKTMISKCLNIEDDAGCISSEKGRYKPLRKLNLSYGSVSSPKYFKSPVSYQSPINHDGYVGQAYYESDAKAYGGRIGSMHGRCWQRNVPKAPSPVTNNINELVGVRTDQVVPSQTMHHRTLSPDVVKQASNFNPQAWVTKPSQKWIIRSSTGTMKGDLALSVNYMDFADQPMYHTPSDGDIHQEREPVYVDGEDDVSSDCGKLADPLDDSSWDYSDIENRAPNMNISLDDLYIDENADGYTAESLTKGPVRRKNKTCCYVVDMD